MTNFSLTAVNRFYIETLSPTTPPTFTTSPLHARIWQVVKKILVAIFVTPVVFLLVRPILWAQRTIEVRSTRPPSLLPPSPPTKADPPALSRSRTASSNPNLPYAHIPLEEAQRVVGLPNSGNTCFIASAFQALIMADPTILETIDKHEIGVSKEMNVIKEIVNAYRTAQQKGDATATVSLAKARIPGESLFSQDSATQWLESCIGATGGFVEMLADKDGATIEHKHNIYEAARSNPTPRDDLTALDNGEYRQQDSPESRAPAFMFQLYSRPGRVQLDRLLETARNARESPETRSSRIPNSEGYRISGSQRELTYAPRIVRFELAFRDPSAPPTILTCPMHTEAVPIRDARYTYHLNSFVVKTGCRTGGHYVAYVRRRDTEGNSRFFYTSDSHVQEVSQADFEKAARDCTVVTYTRGEPLTPPPQAAPAT
jgi:hypothetical protein